jgi:hypothetical protein
MTTHVHLVGSVGLDTVEEVFETAGRYFGSRIKRIPDGEPGGRRMWTSWQYPLLRTNAYLEVASDRPPVPQTGFRLMRIAKGVRPDEVEFGELGYAREARSSYLDLAAAREKGLFPKAVKLQVSLPTPYAVVSRLVIPEDMPAVLAAYEKAMLREVDMVCRTLPHEGIAIQWDVCFEMLQWDGRFAPLPVYPGMEKDFAANFAQLSEPVPDDVELGFHLCYGNLDGKHFVEPQDATKMVELANLIAKSVPRPIAFMHMPVPIQRDDDAFFAPLKKLKLSPRTELYLGLVHHQDGVEGTKRRMAAAGKFVKEFGIAAECGVARGCTPPMTRKWLEVHGHASA